MKKKILFPILAASLLMLGACNNTPVQSDSKTSSDEPVVEGARKILKASLSKDTVEAGIKSKVITDVEGVSYRSDNEDVATVLLKLIKMAISPQMSQVWPILLLAKKAISIEF